MPRSTWEYLTPFRDAIYSYEEFITAVSKFPSFCDERGPHGHAASLTDDEVCMRELAALFAHFSKETGYNHAGAVVPAGYPGAGEKVNEGWRQAFYFTEEVKCAKGQGGCDYYSTGNLNGTIYPRPHRNRKYFGRGAFQLSWNFNYGKFSQVLYGDESVLLNNPQNVAKEGWLAIASAIWFYQTP